MPSVCFDEEEEEFDKEAEEKDEGELELVLAFFEVGVAPLDE